MQSAEPIHWPYRFFFNGHELPKWSNCWHYCQLGDFLNWDIPDDATQWIGDWKIWDIQTRLDHQSVESDYAEDMTYAAYRVLVTLLENPDPIRANIEQARVANEDDTTAAVIFDNIALGLRRIIELAPNNEFCFWISGDQDSLREVMEEMERSHLAARDSNYLPPHRRMWKKRCWSMISEEKRRLRSLS